MKPTMLALALFACALPLTSHAFSDEHIRGADYGPAPAAHRLTPSATRKAGTFQQTIDHTAAAAGATFTQRYWVDSGFANGRADAPVLFHICGEGDAEDSYFLDDNALQWAKSLGARVVYLEHRYYGRSLPFSDLSTDHLQFLTLGNALEDLASFQRWITAKEGWSGKWISVGGSYSGTLSALYRQKHPELVVGALAASAPMISGVGDAVGGAGDLADLSSTDPSDDSGGRQWAYQACTTFGFWEASGYSYGSDLQFPDPALCDQLFQGAPAVNSDDYNTRYHAPFLSAEAGSPSHILFTYGSEDVWTRLGLTTAENHNSKIQLLFIQGAGHHFDLNAPGYFDSQAVKDARQAFLTQAKQWLKQEIVRGEL